VACFKFVELYASGMSGLSLNQTTPLCRTRESYYCGPSPTRPCISLISLGISLSLCFVTR